MTRSAEIAAARAADEKIAAAWTVFYVALEKVGETKKLAKSYRSMVRAAAYADRIAELDARAEKLQVEADDARAAAREIDADLYTGWTRFFLVKHIHSSQYCSSFRATTRVGWLPELSGQTEAEAVAEHGAILCTICFPTAPTAWTEGPKVADDVCSGSGKSIDRSLETRFGFCSGNYATCADCGKKVGMPNSATKIKKHKA